MILNYFIFQDKKANLFLITPTTMQWYQGMEFLKISMRKASLQRKFLLDFGRFMESESLLRLKEEKVSCCIRDFAFRSF